MPIKSVIGTVVALKVGVFILLISSCVYPRQDFQKIKISKLPGSVKETLSKELKIKENDIREVHALIFKEKLVQYRIFINDEQGNQKYVNIKSSGEPGPIIPYSSQTSLVE